MFHLKRFVTLRRPPPNPGLRDSSSNRRLGSHPGKVDIGRNAAGERFWAYILIAPSFVLFAVFVFIPIISTIGLTFTDWNMLSAPKFAGLDNYATIIHDKRLLVVIINTLTFAFVSVVAKLVFGLGLAYLVWQIKPKWLTSLIESSLFFPILLPTSMVALVWGILLNTDVGVINGLLSLIGIAKVPWLSDVKWALTSIIILDVWRGLGFFFIIYLVALRNVPRVYYEAAAIDGAGRWATFRRITLPSISPTSLFLCIIGMIGAIQVFDQSYILTRGGPGDATRTIGYYLWETAFQKLDMGYGATIALLLFGFILAVTIVQFVVSRRWVFYE